MEWQLLGSDIDNEEKGRRVKIGKKYWPVEIQLVTSTKDYILQLSL
jgi:hypothetical protein